MTTKELLAQCFRYVSERVNFRPDIALVLGSGLGAFAKHIETVQTMKYDEMSSALRPIMMFASLPNSCVFRDEKRRLPPARKPPSLWKC